ncbi:MAG: glycosyltransferase N-terminal domain-containing protein [Planctomycetota bacterium]
MGLVLDAVYALTAAATAPWWARKTRAQWGERFGKTEPLPEPERPRVLLHAVSVGETNLIRPLVERLADHAEVVVSVTTDTGIARARTLFEGTARVVRYPLDASWSVRRFLDAVRPDIVALAELEIWPQFIDACVARDIPVAVINGRLSQRSFRGYRKLKWFLGSRFGALAFAAVQDEDYAARFRAMGVPRERCHVVGTMKWDAAAVADTVDGADVLARELGIDPHRPLIVAGSTAPDEHQLLHEATPGDVQLLCAPRKPEWFDAAAAALPGCRRRSDPGAGDASSGRFLLDTIGELRKAYALADLVVVGRSFGVLYGSDPMEPAALGKAIVIGPAVADFQTTVTAMLDAGAIVQSVRDGLPRTLAELMADDGRREQLSRNARQCVLEHQGAADTHARMLLELIPARRDST